MKIQNAISVLMSLVGATSALAYQVPSVDVEITVTLNAAQKKEHNKETTKETRLATSIWQDESSGRTFVALKELESKTSQRLALSAGFGEGRALTSLMIRGEIKAIQATREGGSSDELKIISVTNAQGKMCKVDAKAQTSLFECLLREDFKNVLNSNAPLKNSMKIFRSSGASTVEDFLFVVDMQRNFFAEIAIVARREARESKESMMATDVPHTLK
ncbi:MAG TPA: hypothetical protein VM901_09840 [Bdellovibrionota bacterium]|jgi:hypothetical protein|nr:hypothetical protein [Bdellovibrionota bacterium]